MNNEVNTMHATHLKVVLDFLLSLTFIALVNQLNIFVSTTFLSTHLILIVNAV